MRIGLCTLLAVWAFTSHVHAQTPARIVRLESPLSPRMNCQEIEVFAAGANVATAKGVTFKGTGYRGVDINDRNNARQLIDGKRDDGQRALTMTVETGVGPWVEMDLGKTLAVDEVAVWQSPEAGFADRGFRLLTLLDENRKVVFARPFDIADGKAGVVKIVTAAGGNAGSKPSPLVGRQLPAGAVEWAAIGDMLDAPPMKVQPTDAARQVGFLWRNDDDGQWSRAELSARGFFDLVDLTQPHLAVVRAKLDAGDWRGALDAFRDQFIARLQRTTFLHEHPREPLRYASEADDLVRGILVSFGGRASAETFTPGLIQWAGDNLADKKTLEGRRQWLLAGVATRSLLHAYTKTGDAKYLKRWAEMTDDWAMSIRNVYAAHADVDLRDYFVKEVLQEFNHLASELAAAANARPNFAKDLPSATLARLLEVVVEEYPPAYWLPCRRAAFNHTFTALNAGYITSQLLVDFHAGRRLAAENADHWQRLWSLNTTRDGSMIEIGDEGHLDMALRIGVYFEQMKKDRPAWFTPAYEAKLRTGFDQMLRYLARHPTPNGMGHRYNFADQFERVWGPTENICRIGGMIPRPTYDAHAVYREPQMQAILQSIYGAALDPAKLSPVRKAAREQVIAFYGKDFAPPTQRSDWMPYAGLAYLRGGWSPDAPFLNLICQPIGHPETNGRNWNTEYRWWDRGAPLIHARPMTINGQPQCPDLGQLTLSPGSKTERLAIASPIPSRARWHTSVHFDVTEATYAGPFATLNVNQKEQKLVTKGKPVASGVAGRVVVQIPALRLFLTGDVVKADGLATAELSYLGWSPTTEKKSTKAAGGMTVEKTSLRLDNGDNAGAVLHHFSPGTLNWAKPSATVETEATRADFGPAGYVGREQSLVATGAGNAVVLASVLESTAGGNDAGVLTSIADASAGNVAGFSAEVLGGGKLHWRIATKPSRLTAGNLWADAEAIAVHESPAGVRGVVLGARAMGMTGGGAIDLPARDAEFALTTAGAIAEVLPIHRPIPPVAISRAETTIGRTVFTDKVEAVLVNEPGLEIHYTLDHSEPTRKSPRYTSPLTLSQSTAIRARAFRPGVTDVPFSAANTHVSAISDAVFTKVSPLPAAEPGKPLSAGLRTELVKGTWQALFSHLHLPNLMPAAAANTSAVLCDVSLRQADGPFGIRQTGWIDVPETGVYTFHAPPEYVGASCEPGYDLRLWIDGVEWRLGQTWQDLGAWSIALEKGPHRLMVTFADARSRDGNVVKPGLWRGYPTPWVTWKGKTPTIDVTTPAMKRSPIQSAWLKSEGK